MKIEKIHSPSVFCVYYILLSLGLLKIPYLCVLQGHTHTRHMEKRITDEALRQGAEEGMDAFLGVFTDAYLEVTGGELTAETMPLLTGTQHALLGYHFFHEEVMDGGFCQLIQNGYGPYIFDNPFAKAMRLWGLKEFSKVVYKAKEVYDEHKADLTRERTDEEFMAMYEQYPQFDDLEDYFIENEEEITAIIAYYVDEHIEEFII